MGLRTPKNHREKIQKLRKNIIFICFCNFLENTIKDFFFHFRHFYAFPITKISHKLQHFDSVKNKRGVIKIYSMSVCRSVFKISQDRMIGLS